MIAQGANPSRILDPSFAKSDAYIALIRGALYYMGVSQIDNLIVGLPVSTYRDLSQGLTQTLTGKHTIPNAARNGLQEVQVNCVHALPQPLGAFFDHVYTENNFQELRSRLCLVVAPGFFTLDWRVNAVMTFS